MHRILIGDGICRNRTDAHFEAVDSEDGIPRKTWETYSAFANTDGGTIVFGLRKGVGGLKVVGVGDAEGLIRNIWKGLNDCGCVSSNLLSNSDLVTLEHEGHELVVMTVPRAERSDRPVHTNGNLRDSFIRIEDTNHKCALDEIRSMVTDSGTAPVDRSVVRSSEISDLCRATVDAYRNRFRLMRRDSELNDLDNETFLRMIGAASMEDSVLRPTFAGLLMFGNDLTIALETYNYHLEYRQYEDGFGLVEHLVSDSGDWTGNLFDFFFKTYRMISGTIKHRMMLDGESRRVDENDMDKVVMEALLNALMNADYRKWGGVVVERRPGILTIRNPGTFRISPDVAERGGFTDPRNPTIMRMFNLIGFGEHTGSGIPDMRRRCINMGLPLPKYREEHRPDTVTVEIRTDDDGTRDKGDIIIDLIMDDPKISITAIAEKRGVDRNVVARHIERLKSEGVLERVGGTRGHWRVNPRVNYP